MDKATELDQSSGVPFYKQIKQVLQMEIEDGTVVPDVPFTEAQLLKRFDVSRAPIRQALSELTAEGYVYRKQGKGTFPIIGHHPRQESTEVVDQLSDCLAKHGEDAEYTVLACDRVTPPADVAAALRLHDSERALHILRLISLQNTPMVKADLYLRAPRTFNPTPATVASCHSVLELLKEETGLTVAKATHEAWATAADADVATDLAVPLAAPLLVLQSLFSTSQGRPTAWRRAFHQADLFHYSFTVD